MPLPPTTSSSHKDRGTSPTGLGDAPGGDVSHGRPKLRRAAGTAHLFDARKTLDLTERQPLTGPSSHHDARHADLDELTDDERATITNVIDALITKSKLCAITSGMCLG
ncbi:hypothetical protein [Austwickia sp. TVS 96-490-7B]|uniref:hypothetical protein n=1 Tax=Austwickia sp. TVS 96-490-7B TaxID=2830843 RepID=UPI001C579C9B|nr:hypothetical protein [Austwickia sp. TVS 96-490-7B]